MRECDYAYLFKNDESVSHMRAGYIKNISIGLDNKALFKGFVYDENLYNVHVKEAEKDLEDAINKYSKMGTFNYEVSFAQQRLISLKLKMGVISVGADNNYNLPVPSIIRRWQNVGATIYRTDENGNIIISTDGNNLKVVTSK